MSPLMPGLAPTPVVPDAGLAAISWALAHPRLSPLHGGRVSSRLPKDALFPFLTVYVIPGPGIGGEAAMQVALVQWSCWGARTRKGTTLPDYDTASQLANTLEACLKDLAGEPVAATAYLPAGALADAAITRGPVRMPDPSGCARYDIDSLIPVLAVGPA